MGMRPPSRLYRKTYLTLLAILLAVVAPFAAASLVWPNIFAPAVPGMMVAALGTLSGGYRVGLRLTAVIAVLVPIAVMSHPWPIAGAVVMAVAAVVPAVDAGKGLQNASVMVPIQIGFIVVAPPLLATSIGAGPSHVGGALLAGVVTLAGGLWATACLAYLMRKKPRPVPTGGLTREVSVIYGIVLAFSFGISTWAVMTWNPNGYGAWVMLTIGLMLRPSVHETIRRAWHRVVGTLAGLAISALLVTLIATTGPQLVVSILLITAAVTAMMLNQPYWVYVTFLTPGIILSTIFGSPAVAAEEARLVDTLIGVAVACVMVLAGTLIMKARHPELRINTTSS